MKRRGAEGCEGVVVRVHGEAGCRGMRGCGCEGTRRSRLQRDVGGRVLAGEAVGHGRQNIPAGLCLRGRTPVLPAAHLHQGAHEFTTEHSTLGSTRTYTRTTHASNATRTVRMGRRQSPLPGDSTAPVKI